MPTIRDKELSEKVDKYILEYIDEPYLDIAKNLEKKFGVSLSRNSISNRARKLGAKDRNKHYSKDEINWLLNKSKQGMYYDQVYDDFIKITGKKIKRNSFVKICLDHNIKFLQRFYNLDLYRKNHPIGTEIVVANNVYVKVHNNKQDRDKTRSASSDPNYELKSHIVYKEKYGEIPNNWAIIHLDRNHLNNDISNLRAVSHSTLVRLSNNKWWFESNPELLNLAIDQIELEQILKEGNNGKKYLSKVSQR